jgi:hypothetical protein
MKTTTASNRADEVPPYTQLQRQIHDALRAQHPEWIQTDGECPTCDSYESRLAELIRLSADASCRKLTVMKTGDQQPEDAGFRQKVSVAVTRLKKRWQHDYEQAYPELREIIDLVLDEEERNAWELSLFPHLLLPDLVEARLAKLNL